jgi:hypothetical protein
LPDGSKDAAGLSRKVVEAHKHKKFAAHRNKTKHILGPIYVVGACRATCARTYPRRLASIARVPPEAASKLARIEANKPSIGDFGNVPAADAILAPDYLEGKWILVL